MLCDNGARKGKGCESMICKKKREVRIRGGGKEGECDRTSEEAKRERKKRNSGTENESRELKEVRGKAGSTSNWIRDI